MAQRSGAATLLEIVRLRNARTVNCQFCKSVRYDLARQDGLTEDKVDQIRDGYEESLLSGRKNWRSLLPTFTCTTPTA